MSKELSFQLWFYWIPYFIILLLTIAAIYVSAIQAVKVGRKLDNKVQKDNAKRSLFLLLFSLRGSPVHYDFVKGLNQIEVVFEDVPPVIQAWRFHRASLDNKTQANAVKNWEIERTALLSAMSTHLGYSSISPSELLRDYYPEYHEYQWKAEQDYRKLKIDLYRSGIEVNQLLAFQLKNNLGLLDDSDPDNPKQLDKQ